MRKVLFPLMGLLFLGWMVASTAYADNEWIEGQAAGYSCLPVAGWDTFPASQMIGSQLYGTDGVSFALISDLVVDPATGHVSGVVLSNIPLLGAYEITVPYSTISRTGNDIFVYTAPEDVYQYYGEAPYWSEGLNRYDRPDVAKGFHLTRSLGAVVKGSDGKDLGQLNDFVIDSRDGRVVYGVVAGSGDKLYAVPFSSFTMQSDMEFHLSMTQDKVFSGPAFSWSDASRQSFAHDLYLYYGLQPTWE